MHAFLCLAQASADWQAAGHASGRSWWTIGCLAIAALAGLLFLLLIVRAIARGGRYRAVSVLGPAEVERVRAEVIAAEKRTVGEIAVVVLERSDAHPQAVWLAALSAMLIGLGLLGPLLPWHEPVPLVLSQAALGALGFFLARQLPGFRRAFVAEDRATEMAEEQAVQEFHGHGLHSTAEGTGVLILVSLFEHRVVVLGDRGIDAKVGAGAWADVDLAILDGIAARRLADGLVDGVRKVGAVLAEHFPWTDGDRNEVPDHVEVRHE